LSGSCAHAEPVANVAETPHSAAMDARKTVRELII